MARFTAHLRPTAQHFNAQIRSGSARFSASFVLGGGGTTVTPLAVTQNGTYTAPAGEAYSPVTVNVPGGGVREAEEKDVNFYDYDGTRMYSYTKADFLALNAMPDNPDHSGDDIPLTSQGWNWSLADAKTYVTTYNQLEIGQLYVTTDGKTHIIMEIPEQSPTAQLIFAVRFTQTLNNGVTVDWGDGTVNTYTGTSATNRNHTYAAPGRYHITLNVTNGKVSFAGASSHAIYGGVNNFFNRSRIKSVRFGSNVTGLSGNLFFYCYTLETLTIPAGAVCSGGYMFQYCYSLKSVTFPQGATSIGNYMFSNCHGLRAISLPLGIASVGSYGLSYCGSRGRITLPSSLTSLGQNSLYYDNSLHAITIPAGVTSIGSTAFGYCFSLAYIRLLPTTPPTLGSSAFSNTPSTTVIVVPDESVDTYKEASVWSGYASRIIGESDWAPAA